MAAHTGNEGDTISEEEIRARIAEAAYYRAEQRGFSPGYEMEDWIEAEREVREALAREGTTDQVPVDYEPYREDEYTD